MVLQTHHLAIGMSLWLTHFFSNSAYSVCSFSTAALSTREQSLSWAVSTFRVLQICREMVSIRRQIFSSFHLSFFAHCTSAAIVNNYRNGILDNTKFCYRIIEKNDLEARSRKNSTSYWMCCTFDVGWKSRGNTSMKRPAWFASSCLVLRRTFREMMVIRSDLVSRSEHWDRQELHLQRVQVSGNFHARASWE